MRLIASIQYFSPTQCIFIFLSTIILVVNLSCEIVFASAAADINITVCSNVYWAPYQSHLDFAYRSFPQLKAEFWPNINVVGVPLAFTTPYTGPDDFQTTIGAVRSWIRNDGDTLCDILIGPSISDTAIAMSPLIERPLWIDYGATSTQLSNKNTYPSFLRTIPSDEQGAMKVAELLNYFGWKNIFVIKADNSYATTWTTEISTAHSSNGGTVIRTYNTLSSTVTEESLTQILFEIRAAKSASRVVVAVGVDYALMNTIFQKHDLGKELVVIYSEEPCSNSQIDWNKVHGAFCVTIGYDQDRYDSYMGAFAARSEIDFNRSIEPLLGGALNYPYEYLVEIKDENDVYGSISVDSLWYGLTVLQKYQEVHGGSIAHSAVALADFARVNNITFPYGLTGSVSVNEKGDRKNFIGALHNTAFDNSSAAIGIVGTDGLVTFDAPIHILGQEYNLVGLSRAEVLALVPSDRIAVTVKESSDQPAYVWILIAVLVALIGLGVVAAYILVRRARRGQAIRFAPKNETEPIAIVFTDIQSSTALWAECPLQMCAALDLHNAVIRRCIAEHRGYEVKTIGDSFMVAFRSAADAVHFSLAMQDCLFDADWNGLVRPKGNKVDIDDEDGNIQSNAAQAVINNFYDCFVPFEDPNLKSTLASHNGDILQDVFSNLTGGSSKQLSPSHSHIAQVVVHPTQTNDKPLHNGLRVRVGAAYGFVSIRKTAREGTAVDSGSSLADEDCNFDYFGSTVNMAARIEAIGHGGQVLVSKALWSAAESEAEGINSELYSVRPFGTIVKLGLGLIELRGLADPVDIIQISSPRLSSRTFPPLRLDKVVETNDIDNMGGTTGDDTISMACTQYSRSGLSISGQRRGINEILSELANKKRIKEVDFRMTYCVIEAQMSIIPRADAAALLKTLLAKWRIDYKKEAEGLLAGDKTVKVSGTAMKTALLATRIAPVATLKFDKAHASMLAVPPGGSMVHKSTLSQHSQSAQNNNLILPNTPRNNSNTHINPNALADNSSISYNVSGAGQSVNPSNVGNSVMFASVNEH